MGFLTNISISNDFWHKIAEKPDELVAHISTFMSYGQNSPLQEMIDRRDGRDPWVEEHRRAHGPKPQGVVVHQARHFDEPQCIVNTYGSYPINAQELPSAITFGWLDENANNERHAEAVAKELTDLARRIKSEVAQAKQRREHALKQGDESPYPSRDPIWDRDRMRAALRDRTGS